MFLMFFLPDKLHYDDIYTYVCFRFILSFIEACPNVILSERKLLQYFDVIVSNNIAFTVALFQIGTTKNLVFLSRKKSIFHCIL